MNCQNDAETSPEPTDADVTSPPQTSTPQTSAQQTSPPEVDPEDALRQCLVAFGAGTGHMHVKRDAITVEFWDWFLEPFGNALPQLSANWIMGDRWMILGCAQAIGRLAAQMATARGSYTIEAEDISAARDKVIEANNGGQGGQNPAGKYCSKNNGN